MELHDSLRKLVTTTANQGGDLFADIDRFRDALFYEVDDSTLLGEVHVLVDAIRLGAYQNMVSLLDSGADVDREVKEAGARLARDRGTADSDREVWALAMLGYATGRLSKAQLSRYSAPRHPPDRPSALQSRPSSARIRQLADQAIHINFQIRLPDLEPTAESFSGDEWRVVYEHAKVTFIVDGIGDDWREVTLGSAARSGDKMS